jgi:hypothetical protein
MLVHSHCSFQDDQTGQPGCPPLPSSLYRDVQSSSQFPRVILSVDCCVFHVFTRNFIRRISRMCKDIVFGWQPSPLDSYQCFWDLITGMEVRTREVVAGFCWSKFVWTQLYMSSPMSVTVCTQSLTLWSLFSKFVCSCVTWPVTEHKDSCRDRSQEHICMIDGLVLTSHLEDELTWSFRYP